MDHIDCKTKNNNVLNLRWATSVQNSQNNSLRKDSTSGVKGVSFHKQSNKWLAYISIDNTQIKLGSFTNKEDAINVRVKKANEVFGIFTNTCEKYLQPIAIYSDSS